MGVPKFYRWISERYPCLSQVVKEHQIPEFDNLYLDMNGIIHTCSHPNDDDPHFRITEEKIFKDIFHYIEFLYRMIKPRKVFFMAVDGVAPRAKMNQQRGRRFRSAKEAEELERRAREKGEVLPTEARFDSNCITPGTEFMAKLHEQLKYFVTMKVSTDSMWQGVRIYLSGHETPGEGEHKIMDFIRHERSQDGYDPDTRHCLYGLDADLIMLGLCSHEPHFSLLREEVRFGRRKAEKNRIITPEQTTFHLLHLSLMREYLDHEFSVLKDVLPFDYNLEKIIDDWVLMGFLVGNDFIPNLPHFHIQHDALPMLYKVYIECLPSLGGYINEDGYLNLERFEKYVKKLSQIDYDKFNDTYADLKFFQSKTGRRMGSKRSSAFNKEHKKLFADLGKLDEHFKSQRNNKSNSKSEETDLIELFNPLSHLVLDEDADETEDDDDEYEDLDSEDDDEDDENDDDLFELEFRQHKRDYYMNKLDYASVTPEVMKDQAYGYVRAIQWNLHYYYNGVASWSWYYPHHYAPYISDVKDFSGLEFNYDLDAPLLPFQQLLAVLPSASKQLLPAAYQKLVTDENSPLKEYYPVDFKTDLNGKQQEWEAVVLIPFIEADALLQAVKPLDVELSSSEKARNKHGPHLLYTYTSENLGKYSSSSPSCFPDIECNHAMCEEVHANYFRLPTEQIKKGLLLGVHLDVYFPGFPTLRHIPHTAKLRNEKVKVFQHLSRGENMILTITEQEYEDLNAIAMEYLGKEVFINWPHLEEAKVVEVSNGDERYFVENDDDKKKNSRSIIPASLTGTEQSQWRKQAISIKERYLERFGIEIGEIDVLVFALPLLGRKYVSGVGGIITAEKQYSTYAQAVVLQTVVKDIAIHCPSFQQFKTVEELYPIGSKCFMLTNPHYGCMGEVIDIVDGRIKAQFEIMFEPKLKSVIKNQKAISGERYVQGYAAAQKLGISGYLLSRITGTFYVLTGNPESMNPGRTNIGLNLKFNNRKEEVPGYTKKIDDTWFYSDKAIKILDQYLQRFPKMFENIQRQLKEDMIHVDTLFPNGNAKEALQEVAAWLKTLPCTQVDRQKCGANILDEAVVKAIEEAVIKNQEERHSSKMQTMLLKPNVLYRPFHCHGNLPPDPSASFNLFDRVINVRDGFSVPLGLRGTLIGIHSGEKETDVMYDVVFDREFPGGLTIRCSPSKGYQLPPWTLLNLTYGARQVQKVQPVMAKKFASKPEVSNNAMQQGCSYARTVNDNRNDLSYNKDGGYSSSYLDPNIKWSNVGSPGMKYVSPNVPPRLQSQFLNIYPPENVGNRWNSSPSSKNSTSPARNARSPSGTGFNHSPNSPFVEKQQQECEFSTIWEGLKNMTMLPSQPSSTNIQQSQDNVPKLSVPVGKSLPVEELFEEARKAEQKQNSAFPGTPPSQNKPNKEYGSPGLLGIANNSPRKFPQAFQAPATNAMQMGQTRAVDVLRQYCLQNLCGNPLYDCSTVGPMQLHQAKVVLPNGKTFSSIPKPTQLEASENAAEEALKYLKIKLPAPVAAPSGQPSVTIMPNPFLPPFASAGLRVRPAVNPVPNQMHFPPPPPCPTIAGVPQALFPDSVCQIPNSYLAYNRQLLQQSNFHSRDSNLLNSVDGVIQPIAGGENWRSNRNQEGGFRKGTPQQYELSYSAHKGGRDEKGSPKKSSSARDANGSRRENAGSWWQRTSANAEQRFERSDEKLSWRREAKGWRNEASYKGNTSNRTANSHQHQMVQDADFLQERLPSKETTTDYLDNHGQRAFPPGKLQSKQSVSAAMLASNPFVPLQVTQKQKHTTPEKHNTAQEKRKAEETKSVLCDNRIEDVNKLYENRKVQGNSTPKTKSHSSQVPSKSSQPSNIDIQKSTSTAPKSTTSSGRSQRRSRLAAKFGNMPTGN